MKKIEKLRWYNPLWFINFPRSLIWAPIKLFFKWSDSEWRGYAIPILGVPVIFAVAIRITAVHEVSVPWAYATVLLGWLIGWFINSRWLENRMNLSGIFTGLPEWVEAICIGMAIGVWF